MPDELLNYLNSSPFFAGSDLEDSRNRLAFFEKFVRLPPNLKRMMSSAQTADYLASLGKKYLLTEQQVILLAIIARHAVIGDVYIRNVPPLISSHLKVSNEIAGQLFNEIVSVLFASVIEDIERIQREKFGDKINQTGGQTPPQQKIPGADLPETGGNIIDLRNQK